MSKWLVLIPLVVGLTGCNRAEEATFGPPAVKTGRYLGIGVYSAGPLWSQLKQAKAPSDPDTARLTDDLEIVVVVDSQTGEVRQCGNMTGHCTSMNPWKQLVAADGQLPARLIKHADQLDAEAAQAESESAR